MSTTSGQWNSSSRQWNSNSNRENKWIGTPTVGLDAAYNVTPLIAVVAGLYLIKSGALYNYTYDNEGGTGNYSQRERYTTLRLPILARFLWGTTWQYYGLAGFYLSQKLCGKYVYKYPSQDYEQTGKIKFKEEPENYEGDDLYLDPDNYKRFTVGFLIGAGIRRAIGPGYLSFNLMFGLGFCDFYKWENDDDKPDGYKPTRDRNLSFRFGYALPLGQSL